jgi:hypothetical protein
MKAPRSHPSADQPRGLHIWERNAPGVPIPPDLLKHAGGDLVPTALRSRARCCRNVRRSTAMKSPGQIIGPRLSQMRTYRKGVGAPRAPIQSKHTARVKRKAPARGDRGEVGMMNRNALKFQAEPSVGVYGRFPSGGTKLNERRWTHVITRRSFLRAR